MYYYLAFSITPYIFKIMIEIIQCVHIKIYMELWNDN